MFGFSGFLKSTPATVSPAEFEKHVRESLEKVGYVVTGPDRVFYVSPGPSMDTLVFSPRFVGDGWDNHDRIDRRLAAANYQAMTFIEFIFGE